MASGSLGKSSASVIPATNIAMSIADARAVECAVALFLERGIDAVKMTDIADAAGVGVATLYRHFSTKAAIAAQAAILMWGRLESMYDNLVASDAYLAMSGAERLEALLSTFCDAYVYQTGFASFLDEFDRLVLSGAVAQDALDAYTRMLATPYPHYEAAYQLGVEDGSISGTDDFGLFYRTVAHALVSVACKLSRGEVLPSDDFSHAQEELRCLIGICIRSLKA